MILGRLAPKILKLCGGSWPTDYTCFDLETSGFSRDRDVIVEWGHCLVRDGKVEDRLSLVVNWYGSGLVPDDWLTGQLNRVRKQMAKDGRKFRVTPAVMRAEGVPPDKVLPFIFDFLTSLQENGEMLVTHNGWRFDVEMVLKHFTDFLDEDFEFHPDRLIDTGAIEKASQITDDWRAAPADDETMKTYFQRIANWVLPGVKWNLDTWCMNKYDLALKHGANTEDAHQADYDAWLVHLLMEEFRGLLLAPPPPVDEDDLLPAQPKQPPRRKKKTVKKSTAETQSRKRRRGQRSS
jgi:DNA polymerase III epsilon subunit-like protein